MGVIRLLLAISVVLAHCLSGAPLLIGGPNAVRLFYCISGFLISHVICESKSYSTPSRFYINRILRLYPVYFVVAGFGLLLGFLRFFVSGHSDPVFTTLATVPLEGQILLCFSNLFILCQDWVMFLKVSGGHIRFASDYSISDPVLYHGLLVPQAWSLAVELQFYVIAPYLLPRRSILYVLIFASIALRVFLVLYGVGNNDPWSYRFFPNELALFLLGALAHQIILPKLRSILTHHSLLPGFFVGLFVLLFVAYPLFPVLGGWKDVFLVVFFLPSMPFLFLFQGANRFDRFLGQLSYPLYLDHMVVFTLVQLAGGHLGKSTPPLIAIATLVTSLLAAIGIERAIVKPIELVRNSIRGAQQF